MFYKEEDDKFSLDAFKLYEFVRYRDMYDHAFRNNPKIKSSYILSNDKEDQMFVKLLRELYNKQDGIIFLPHFKDFVHMLNKRLVQLEEAFMTYKEMNQISMWHEDMISPKLYNEFKVKYEEEQELKEYKRLKKKFEKTDQ